METAVLATTATSLPSPLDESPYAWGPSSTLDLIEEWLTEGGTEYKVKVELNGTPLLFLFFHRSAHCFILFSFGFHRSKLVKTTLLCLGSEFPQRRVGDTNGGDQDREYDRFMFLFNLSFLEGCRKSPETKFLGHCGFQLLCCSHVPSYNE